MYYTIDPIIQNIRLTNRAARPIKIKPIPDCLRIVNPALYFLSSPAAVTIWKPPRRRIQRAISPRNPNTKLIALLIVVRRAGSVVLAVALTFVEPATLIPSVPTCESVKFAAYVSPTSHITAAVPATSAFAIVCFMVEDKN